MLLPFVRYGLPGLIFLSGCVVWAVDHDKQRGVEIGSMLMGSAFAVLLIVAFTKVFEGAWIVLLLIPIVIVVFKTTKRH